ncbi:flavin-containing monooxygenase [Mesorhizobium sp. A556]
MQHVQTVVVGAGPAGLACASALKSVGLSAIVLEKAQTVGATWRGHYDRLHLHTHRKQSGLPGFPIPSSYPKYPSRDQVVAYLEKYSAHHGIRPRFGAHVSHLGAAPSYTAGWLVKTGDMTLAARNVVVATGIASWPRRAEWAGKNSFPGRVLHSSEYVNPKPLQGGRVLVVGFGNSGGEIAMELANAGVDVTVSVRSPVNVIPRELFGISIVTWSILEQPFPYRLMDALNKPLLRLVLGDLQKLGLRQADKGPLAQVVEDRKIPILDIGTLDLVRRGKISIRNRIVRISEADVHFADGLIENFDAMIEATGYSPDLRTLLPEHESALDGSGGPRSCGSETDYPGLYFCGQIPVSTGQLRQIGMEARRIASLIKATRCE